MYLLWFPGLSQDDKVDLRSAGGPGAGGFIEPPVLFEDEEAKPMPDQHFLVSVRDRLRLPVCPPQATCQHRRQDGTLCGAPLDSRGKHALKCEVGPTREARHDGLRDFTAAFHPKVSGYVAPKEQRVTAWDRVNPRTGLLEEAPALTAATSRVSRPVPAGMEWLRRTPCGGRGAVTLPLGVSWCH